MNEIDNKKEQFNRTLEDAVGVIRLNHDSPLEDFFDVVERMNTRPLDSSGCIRDGLLNALDCVDIAVYRHPDIEVDLKLGIRAILLALVEAGVAVQIEDRDGQVEKAVRDNRSEVARRAADFRYSKPGGSRELGDKIRAIWATGKYSSRDICAEEEWRGLGFGSFKAARNALLNTPPPRCAQGVPAACSGNS